jgi:hypothetical protein
MHTLVKAINDELIDGHNLEVGDIEDDHDDRIEFEVLEQDGGAVHSRYTIIKEGRFRSQKSGIGSPMVMLMIESSGRNYTVEEDATLVAHIIASGI